MTMYSGTIVDCDVHHTRASDRELLDYLPRFWRDYMEMPGHGRLQRTYPAIKNVDPPDGSNKRLDAFPASGGPPGSDYELMREQLLDSFDVDAVLLSFDVGQEAAQPNPAFALALSRAMNDWSAECWLERFDDERLYSAILVPNHVPADGAEEIRRCAGNPRFASVLLAANALGQPLGHPVYWPLYEAAAEADLPVHLHAGGGEILGSQASHMSGGWTHNSRAELYVTYHQSVAHHLTSMIGQGVFERFPNLRVLVAETGLAWVPWLVASMESHAEQFRRESPLCRRRPLDYLHEHVGFTTQPSEVSAGDAQRFVEQMSLIEGVERLLCFSSDYPHWDTDDPRFIARIMPDDWHESVFQGNARRILRLPRRPSRPAVEAVAAAPRA